MRHTGDLVITNDNAARFADLTEVTGELDIRAANAQLPALTSVGGGLSIRADRSLFAPSLAVVAGHKLPTEAEAAARLRDVAKAALASDDALDMGYWHNECGTSHCIAGWAIHLAGAEGYKLERELGGEGRGSAAAGAILLGLEAAHHFHIETAAARAWLQSKLEAP